VHEPRSEVELADVSDIRHGGTGSIGSFLVRSSGQFGKALFLQDRGDRRRTERLAFADKSTADIMDRQVLFPERDELVPQPLLLARRSSLSDGEGEELAIGAVRN
jgi:hypothetical protein